MDLAVDLSDRARQRLDEIARSTGTSLPGLRLEVLAHSPFAPRVDLTLIDADEQEEGEVRLDVGGFDVVVDPREADRLEAVRIDWVTWSSGGAFNVEATPAQDPGVELPDAPADEQVRFLLEEWINPSLALHGGAARLVRLEDGVALIELDGGCQGCSMAGVTLENGIRELVMGNVEGVTDVRDVTNHAAGKNPFY